MIDDKKREEAKKTIDEIADEIENAHNSRDMQRAGRLQQLYVNMAYDSNSISLEDMRDVVEEYLVRQNIHRDGQCDFPSLREVASNESNSLGAATRDVLFIMLSALREGIEMNVRRACEETEKAAARYITTRKISR